MLKAQTNNYSLTLDGTTYVDLGTSSDLVSPLPSLTIACWFKNLDITQDPHGNGLVSFLGSAAVEAGYALQYISSNPNGDEYAIRLVDENGGISIPFTVPDIHGWNHVAFTLNGSSVILYVNGDLISTTPFVEMGANSGAAHLFLGTESDGNGYPEARSECSLDDFMIWQSVLTQSEIQGYMSCPPSGNESGLIGYWNMEDGSGNTVSDLTSNQYDGFGTNLVWSSDAPGYSCCSPSLINTQPNNQNVTVGGNADFSVVAAGANLQYQWQKDDGSGFLDLTNNSTYTGVNTNILNISNIQSLQNGELYRCIVIDSLCQDTSDSAILDVVVSITSIDNNTMLEFYPNPAQDILTIEYAKTENTVLNGVIYNNLGQAVEQIQLVGKEGQLQINIDQLSAGIYWLKVEDQSLSFVKE